MTNATNNPKGTIDTFDTDEEYRNAVDLFISHCDGFFADVEFRYDVPTHTVQRRARDYDIMCRSARDFLYELTHRVGDNRIEWELDVERNELRIGFFHHDAPVGAPVIVNPIKWIECADEDCVEAVASERYQNVILGLKELNAEGLCSYCAKRV